MIGPKPAPLLRRRTIPLGFCVAGLLSLLAVTISGFAASPGWLAPNALTLAPGGSTLFVSCYRADLVAVLNLEAGTITHSIKVPPNPTGLAVSPDGQRLWVTGGNHAGRVAVIDTKLRRVVERLPAGHTPGAPVLSPNGHMLYVCNRFDNDVSFLDLLTKKQICRVRVQREPVAAAVTLDGRFLLVANLLHNGRADVGEVAAALTVIDTGGARVVREIRLPNGSGSLNDIRISPDGRFAVVTHILSRFHLPTTQLDRGWMNTNAKTIVDLERMEVVNTVLLDSVDRGAANPWGAAWSADGQTLVVAHAGTHEISVLDFPAVLTRLERLPQEAPPGQPADYASASRTRADVPNDLAFLVGAQRRIRLPEGQLGPRAVATQGNRVYVANYFSDTIAVLDTASERPNWGVIALGPKPQPTTAQLGEFYFHDAGICLQGWQSCASCHPGDGRVDALNWDLLNDGVGNPKNNKSLLLSLSTPPAMSRGVRETGEQAVRAGIRHILFTVQPPEVGDALDAYLQSLRPGPSPQLRKGALSQAARRGETLYYDSAVGCASCHPSGLFTDLKSYRVGTHGPDEQPDDRFDTPTLVEAWRTAPYLHDGSATTIHEVLTTRNSGDEHGKTSHLTEQQIRDLTAYVLSL